MALIVVSTLATTKIEADQICDELECSSKEYRSIFAAFLLAQEIPDSIKNNLQAHEIYSYWLDNVSQQFLNMTGFDAYITSLPAIRIQQLQTYTGKLEVISPLYPSNPGTFFYQYCGLNSISDSTFMEPPTRNVVYISSLKDSTKYSPHSRIIPSTSNDKVKLICNPTAQDVKNINIVVPKSNEQDYTSYCGNCIKVSYNNDDILDPEKKYYYVNSTIRWVCINDNIPCITSDDRRVSNYNNYYRQIKQECHKASGRIKSKGEITQVVLPNNPELDLNTVSNNYCDHTIALIKSSNVLDKADFNIAVLYQNVDVVKAANNKNTIIVKNNGSYLGGGNNDVFVIRKEINEALIDGQAGQDTIVVEGNLLSSSNFNISNVENLVGTYNSQRVDIIASKLSKPALKHVDLNGGGDVIGLGKVDNATVTLYGGDHLMLLDDPYLLDDRIKGTESYKVKLYVSRKDAGDISINFNNKIVQGFLFLPYSVQQLVEIIYNSSLKQLVLEFSDNTNSLRKIKIFNSSLEQQFNFSFLLQENMGVAAQSVLIPLIQYNSNQTIQQVKNLHLDIDIQTDLNNQQSRQLIDKLATLTNINFTISFTVQTKTTKYLIETHSNKHYISTKQPDGVDKKALYISLNAGDDIYFIDDYNHITINSATIANNATLSDLIIFQLPTPELLDIRCLGQGNDIIIEYRNIAQPVYEYYNPSLRPPYNNKLILDFREIKLKDIIFRGVGDNMHLMSPGNKTVILPNWDIDNYHRIMLLPKEGILNNKLLDLTNCTIIQLMLQPHLSMNATMDISLCDNATVTNRGFQSFQFCKNQCISKADLPQFGKIILKNNGNATRNFKVINGNVTYGLKIENDGFNWRKVDTGQTLLILIPENKKIYVLEAKDLNNYNALSIPQIDKALNLDFNQQRGHLILKLKNLNKLIIIKDFYNHTLSQQLVTINLREESINALELHNKFTQAQVIDSPYVIYDLNPVVPQFKIKLSINQPNDTGKVAILDLHKVKKVENIAFSKREQDLIIVCKSSNDQGVILTNTIEIINWNSQLINRAILLHNGQMFNLIKCTTQQLHGLNLSLYVDHSQDECGIERYRSKREVNDLGKQQNLEGKVTNSGSRPALWGVERLLAIGSIFNTIKNIVEKWLSNSLPDLSTAEQLPAQVVQVADSLQDKSQIFPDTRNPLPQSKQQQTNTPMNLQADIITALEVLEQCNNAHYDSGQDSHAKNSQDENIRADKAPICYAKPSQCHTTIFEDCISKAVYISNEHVRHEVARIKSAAMQRGCI